MSGPDEFDAYPPVAALLPHAGAWVLLSRVVEHAVDATTCLVTVGDGFPFRLERGLVPSVLGLEYMAQCIAVHGALRARREGQPAPAGLLLGARQVEVHTDGFRPGQRLEVAVRRLWGTQTFFIFECRVRDEATRRLMMDGDLQVFRTPASGSQP